MPFSALICVHDLASAAQLEGGGGGGRGNLESESHGFESHPRQPILFG